MALTAAAARRFQHRIDGEARALLAAAGSADARPVEARELEKLPLPVRRWLEVSGTVGRPHATTVRLEQSGEFRMGPDKPWMPVAAEQYFSVDPPGFVWSVKSRMMGVLPIAGRDRYADGQGHMLIKLASLLTVADGAGPEIDQGAMVRYLTETVWFPSAALRDDHLLGSDRCAQRARDDAPRGHRRRPRSSPSTSAAGSRAWPPSAT